MIRHRLNRLDYHFPSWDSKIRGCILNYLWTWSSTGWTLGMIFFFLFNHSFDFPVKLLRSKLKLLGHFWPILVIKIWNIFLALLNQIKKMFLIFYRPLLVAFLTQVWNTFGEIQTIAIVLWTVIFIVTGNDWRLASITDSFVVEMEMV